MFSCSGGRGASVNGAPGPHTRLYNYVFFLPQPSMRAYGEQIEVMSRRYLQDHRHKWSDSITKNEVRAKLKDYIVKMIAK